MQQKTRSTGKPFTKALPFTLGAVVAALVLVACERPGTRADAGAAPASDATANAASAIEAPREMAAAPQPAATPSPPPSEGLADTVITGKVKAAILTDPAMTGADVSVNTDRGVVVLAGLVKTPEQTAIASAYAQRQDGVMRVDNHLSLAPQ
jgi:osmotically-inducible protein OsmY